MYTNVNMYINVNIVFYLFLPVFYINIYYDAIFIFLGFLLLTFTSLCFKIHSCCCVQLYFILFFLLYECTMLTWIWTVEFVFVFPLFIYFSPNYFY